MPDLKPASKDELGLLSRDANGLLRDTVTDARVIVWSCSAYRSMCDALYEQFQSGAGVILYRMGEGYSRKLVAAIPKLGLERGEIVTGFQKLAYLAGWGKINLKIIDEDNAECVVEKCAFVLRRNDIGPTSCHFFSGVLASAASAILQKPFKSHEVKCETSGSNLCKFKIYARQD